jgi:Ca-activated chloride channel homolog
MMRSSIVLDAWFMALQRKVTVGSRAARVANAARIPLLVLMVCQLAVPLRAQAPDAPKPKVPASDEIPKAPPNKSPQPAQRQQNDPRLSEAQAKITVNTSLVVLPVTVKDRSGNLVPDLRRDEFRVFEDNVEQKIDVFTAEAFPLSMVILIDDDLKTKDAEEVRGSLEAIVGGMSLEDEAFICRFDQFFHPGAGFTRDQDVLLTQLQRTTKQISEELSGGGPSSGAITNGPSINGHSPIGDQPNTYPATIQLRTQSTKALDDAVYGSAQLLHDRGRARRKIILLISDGANGGKKTNTMTYDSVVRTLNQDNIAVYSVAVASAFLDRKFSRLVDYAHDSGGDVYFAAKRDALQDLYARVTEEARNQYTLAYVPHGTDRSLESHSVEVRIKREGLTIQTRDRYYIDAVPGATRR